MATSNIRAPLGGDTYGYLEARLPANTRSTRFHAAVFAIESAFDRVDRFSRHAR